MLEITVSMSILAQGRSQNLDGTPSDRESAFPDGGNIPLPHGARNDDERAAQAFFRALPRLVEKARAKLSRLPVFAPAYPGRLFNTCSICGLAIAGRKRRIAG